MLPEMSASQSALKSSVRAFARQWIEPEAREYDEKGVFPSETFHRMGKAGFLGLTIPARYGGSGGGAQEYAILGEEVARECAAYMHNGHYQTVAMLLRHGTEAQRAEILPKLATGEWLAATAISEPEVGSSFQQMASRAKKEGPNYLLEGHKVHINDAAEARVVNFFAQAPGGLTVFLVDPREPGFRILGKMDPIGLRASPIYEFVLQDYSLPEDRRVGAEGQGLEVFFSAFNFSRIGNASCLLGIARGALEKAVAYAQTRKVGEKTVLEFQGNRWDLAEMATQIEGASLLRDKAAWVEDQGKDSAREACMAKLLCAEVSQNVVLRVIQLTGSYGCYRQAPFERYLRDAKALCIAGGTLEVMKNTIAARLLREGLRG